MYPLARAALFKLDAERAHAATLAALARAPGLARGLYGRRVPTAPVELMGLSLANPVGLAAGWDKDGVAVDALAGLGFGFIEVGTVTPRAQPGNDRPRLFRLADRRALINRLGFNNAGAPALAERLGQRQARAVVGVNIGKNRDTPSADAARDYCAALETVYAVADYVCVNVSSPNTRGLRDLQTAAALDDLLGRLIATRDHCASASGRRLPLAVKIAPDLDDAALDRIAERVIAHRVDGVIATNTTTDRHGVALRWSGQPGGLSGAPLRARSNAVIAALGQRLAGAIPIIGVGGIGSARDAADKFAAGASALQLYTGLVYRGPRLVRECVNAAKNQALK